MADSPKRKNVMPRIANSESSGAPTLNLLMQPAEVDGKRQDLDYIREVSRAESRLARLEGAVRPLMRTAPHPSRASDVRQKTGAIAEPRAAGVQLRRVNLLPREFGPKFTLRLFSGQNMTHHNRTR